MPVPSLRNQNAVPVSVFDCIRRGGPKMGGAPADIPDQDDQRFEQIASRTIESPTDAKLLWTQDLIPYRTITCWGPVRTGSSAGIFSSVMQAVMDDPSWWVRATVSTDGVNFSPPQWGGDYFRPSDLGFNILMPGTFESNNSYLWSGYQYGFFGGTFIGNTNVDLRDYLLIGGMLTQILCPTPWKPLNYELWTVTTRWGIVDPSSGEGGGFGIVPSPFPWSSSADFQRQSSGTLHPGQTLIIPCPINTQPGGQAPGTFQDPPATISKWSGWGVSQFIVFT